MNVEGMYSAYLKKTEQNETILRNSLFDILRFCGSLFNIAKYHRRIYRLRGLIHLRRKNLVRLHQPILLNVIIGHGLQLLQFLPALIAAEKVPETFLSFQIFLY
jgi:hypothetical protein